MAKRKSFEDAFLDIGNEEEVKIEDTKTNNENKITENKIESKIEDNTNKIEIEKNNVEPVVIVEGKREVVQSEELKKDNLIVERMATKEEVRVINQEVVNTMTVVNEFTLNQYIQSKIAELENKIKSESGSRFQPRKRLSYSDKYIGVTISIRPELKAIIEDLKDKTVLDKYEIIEMLLIEGLKSINFDE